MLARNSTLVMRELTASTASFQWRNQIKGQRLASQISSVLLQRQNWTSILGKLNLSLALTPDIFLQVLRRIENNAEISLAFFNWAKTSLGFEPDLKSHCKVIRILVESQTLQPARTLFDSLIPSQPAPAILDLMVEACKGRDSQSLVSSFVLERYSTKGLVSEALAIFSKVRASGYLPCIRSCNSLLDALQLKGDIKLAWKFYAAIIRYRILPDSYTWSLVSRLLCNEGKLENAVRLLNLGVCNAAMYNLVIDCYCKKGSFRASIDLLNGMHSKNLIPGFGTYSSILDGACKFGDLGVVETVTREMVAKDLLPAIPFSEYDPTIQKLCSLGKTYAAEMFFRKARADNITLQDVSHGCILKAFSKEERLREAIEVYGIIRERGIIVSRSSIYALVDVVCNEEPSEELYQLLMEVIRKGFTPCASNLSKIIAAQCNKGRWREAEELLMVTLEKGFFPDSCCCCALVEHYCSKRQIDSALALHDKVEKLGRSLDVITYNVLLDELFKERRIGDALRVFDHMRTQNVVNSASFSIMIRGLCRVEEMRKAMKIHDEMLKMKLKPDEKTYKRLISQFV
ncbi:pentatricopeptide repeat-containing protein At4g21170-like [Telopea speciosissima]|uniref:pentatricopeptide repeat-containing protein At4g21170-like n=1 Tax=Telopea speciosissima TaxID=54955 RepID=UPI001CC65681|nr:pentatricopeptide repeat-containing protein At4g21170-like [Telopea speciosissima]